MHIDAHFHSWQLARGDYGWLTPRLGAIYRDVAISDWLAVAQPMGVAAGLLVQAAPTLAETQHLLALAHVNACVLGVVGWVDMATPDAVASIMALAQNPWLKGLRPMLHDLPDPDWILHSAVQPALTAMDKLGVVFDALIKPEHIRRIRTLAQHHPSLRIVVDHGAKPNIAAGQFQPWADDMAALAQEPLVYCKLSGLLTEAGATPAPEAAAGCAQYLLACFGADRLLWGSDWPVLELAATYGAWWEACQRTLIQLSPAQQMSVLGGNAQRVYGLVATSA